MANFPITRKPFADALDRLRVTFNLEEKEAGDTTINDRLHVEAECPTEDGSYHSQVANDDWVKAAVVAGVLTQDEALDLKATLGKLVNWLLVKYD